MTIETPAVKTETLAHRLGRGPLGSEVALDILMRVLKALALLHWSGLVHGGITPRSIILFVDGHVDIKGAKPGREGGAGGQQPIPETPAYPEYLAPEQIAGRPADPRSDVFSVAVIAHEMLTGKNPYLTGAGMTASEVMARIADGPSPQIPQAALAGLPAVVGPALGVALAKDPDDRFASAEEFLQAMQIPKAGEETRTAPADPVKGQRKRSVFRYYALPAVLAVVTLGVVLAILLFSREPVGPTQTTAAPPASATSTSAPDTTLPPTTTTASPTTTTSGTTPTTTATTGPALPVTRFEDDAAALAFNGTWEAGADPQYSGGAFQFANASGTTVTATFYGTSLTWIAKQGPVYGVAKVTLDGASTFDVDLYAADVTYQQSAWETGALPVGLHTVTIEWTGDKNAAASDTNICVDSLDVAGELVSVKRYEQTEALLVGSGTWTPSASESASGGTFSYADSTDASVAVRFTGRLVSIIAKTGPNYGQAMVTIDGTQTFTVDLYSAEIEWQAVVWSSGLLPEGDHTITLERTGTKNAASTGTNIDLDAVQVIGTLR